MTLTVNPDAVAFAEQMIGEGNYRINTVWREAQPSASATRRFADVSDPALYSKWFLAVDADAPESSYTRYQLPIGDFRNVHRSGLLDALARAERAGSDDVAAAADELLFFFDRISAC